MSLKKLAAGVALSTLASLAATGAMAQSTASQVAEVVVTTNAVRSTGGLAVQTQVAKSQSIVTQQYIDNQPGSVNAAQLINLLPGVSYSSSDPTGILSDDFRIHGFDGNHVSWTIDGTPVNDTGNYASYPGEYLTGEVTDRVTVNIGQAEIDSPSASAIGGTVNIITKTPPRTLGAIASASGGSYGYYRGYAELDTGEIGPWGTRAFFSANGVHSNSWQSSNQPIEREGVDFRVYQPLRDKDFISIAGTYNSNRAYFYESNSLAQFAQYGRDVGWNKKWVVPSVTPGKADGIGTAAAAGPDYPQGLSDASQGFYGYHINPVDFGDIRVQSRFDLSHGFTLTFDPYFFYTLANGGGNTSLKETDPRFAGNTGKTGCVDVNGDGDCLDTVLVYSPSNTQTHRFGLSTSLLYDLDEHSHFQFAYNLDYGNHRQTGAYGLINQQTGFPDSPFGGLRSQTVNTQDGSFLRSRDRFSVAQLNQVAFNYIGRWMDDKLHVNIGVRNPMLTRKLNQYCYTYSGTSQYCDTIDPTLVQAAYNAGVAAGNSNALNTLLFGSGASISFNTTTKTPNFRMPFKQTYNYQKALPNAGVSYNFTPEHQIFFSYNQGFSAPRTDNLYSSSPQTVAPEITDNYGAGYRYQAGRITASVYPWYSVWTNHIVSTVDHDDPTITIDRNVGKVSLYGVDLEAGFKPTDNLSIYASASFMHSRLENNYSVKVSSGPLAGQSADLPVKGKELVLTPDQAYSLRGEYTWRDLTIGIQGKYTGKRYLTDTNDLAIGEGGQIDLDLEYQVPGTGGHTVLQLNAQNIFSTYYYNRASTTSASKNTDLGGGNIFSANANSIFYYVSAPATVYGTVKLKF
jgi:iron complex outermembrane receptor protein